MVESLVAKPYQLESRERWLIAAFPEPWCVVSWAIVNGAWQRTDRVAWLYLQLGEIKEVEDPVAWMRAQMHSEGLAGAVGFLTSRRAGAWVEAEGADAECSAWAVGTVGLSNALRAGDPSVGQSSPGTINLLVCSSQPLTTEAALEAMGLVSEAKTLALLESGVRSVCSFEPATGTGTDYIAIAWPATGTRSAYAGKHTAVGSAIGQAAYRAVAKGARAWLEERESR